MKKVLKVVKAVLWDVPVGIAVAPVVVPAIHVANAIWMGTVIKAVTTQASNNEAKEIETVEIETIEI